MSLEQEGTVTLSVYKVHVVNFLKRFYHFFRYVFTLDKPMNEGLCEEETKFLNFYRPKTKDGYLATEIRNFEEG